MAQLPRDQHATDAATKIEKKRKEKKNKTLVLWRFVANTRETVDGMAGFRLSHYCHLSAQPLLFHIWKQRRGGGEIILFTIIHVGVGKLFGILKLNNKNNKQTIFSRVWHVGALSLVIDSVFVCCFSLFNTTFICNHKDKFLLISFKYYPD